MDDFAKFEIEDGCSSSTNKIIHHVFHNNKKVGLGFEELEDNSWLVERVDPGTQASHNNISVGMILTSINGKPPPQGADGLAKTFSKAMRKKKGTMMLGFTEPSLFRVKRKPSLTLYQYKVGKSKKGRGKSTQNSEATCVEKEEESGRKGEKEAEGGGREGTHDVTLDCRK